MKRALALLVVSASLEAASTAAWEMNTYQDFLRGRFEGVSLTRGGRLTLAPRLETLFQADQPAIWSLARASDGTLYAGTGHGGRVLRVDGAGKGQVVWTAEQPEVFAVALDSKGGLYAGSSPNGKVYRIEKGGAREYFAPQARYIWALAFGKDGALYVGTGDQGKVYRVEAAGQGELYYDTGQVHVTALGFDKEGRLLVGTEPNGILYRVSAKDKAFVLYDANLPEIRSIAVSADGAVYAAALGGSLATRTAAGGAGAGTGALSTTVTAPATSITVEAGKAQGGLDIKPKSEQAKPAAPSPQVTTQFTPLVDYSGLEKSAIYRINPDHTVETLWSSKEENVYDLYLDGQQVVFATDAQGRVYRLSPDRKATLVVQTNEGETTRLAPAGNEVLAATGSAGKILRLSTPPVGAGTYESPVHDAGAVARWGQLSWRGDTAPASKIQFRTRTGNTARPDRTWSEWSEPLIERGAVKSPNARYVQWKAELEGSQGAGPILDSVILSYLPQNSAPVIRSIQVTTQWTGAPAAKTAAAQPAATSAYSITVTDTGEAGASTATGTPTQTLARAAAQRMQITWQAEDTDGDPLVYGVHFRGEEEKEWKLLKANHNENTLQFDADVLADGRYFFRVTASDRQANPPAQAREAELVSSPVLVDNTPPRVTLGGPRRLGGMVEVDVEAADAASPLRRAEFSVDAGPWAPLEPLDGVVDGLQERFLLRAENLTPGEHLLVVRACDAAGNAGLGKVVVR